MSDSDKFEFKDSTELPSDQVVEQIIDCMSQFMRSSSLDRWKEKFFDRKNPFIQWVELNGKVVAFKAGYELRPGIFYSWLGGVKPECRKKGIGQRLMQKQHDYAKQIGCQIVQTISSNHYRDMMVLNLKNGFDIVETKKKGDEVRVVMSKNLT